MGDLLLAGPALVALSQCYSQADFIATGHRERWALFRGTLPLTAVWDGAEARWTWLYSEQEGAPSSLVESLAGLDLAVVFTPRPHHRMLARLGLAGVSRVVWVPSFDETTKIPVPLLQARHLGQLGLAYEPQPLKLTLASACPNKKAFNAGVGDERAEVTNLFSSSPIPPPQFLNTPSHVGNAPLVAVAPGSGNPRKNWPLSHYFELTRALAWQHQVHVVWVVGPAERKWLPYLRGIAQAQGMHLLAEAPLPQAAQVPAHCRLYIGGDSGLTHLAAAAGARQVLALFGPTDPHVWAPFSPQVTVLTSSVDCRPCAPGRDISCLTGQCLRDLAPETVLRQAAQLLTISAEISAPQ